MSYTGNECGRPPHARHTFGRNSNERRRRNFIANEADNRIEIGESTHKCKATFLDVICIGKEISVENDVSNRRRKTIEKECEKKKKFGILLHCANN